MVEIIQIEPDYNDLAFKPAMTWDEFKEQVAKFAHEKRPDLFYFRVMTEVVIGKLSFERNGNLWVSMGDDEFEAFMGLLPKGKENRGKKCLR